MHQFISIKYIDFNFSSPELSLSKGGGRLRCILEGGGEPNEWRFKDVEVGV